MKSTIKSIVILLLIPLLGKRKKHFSDLVKTSKSRSTKPIWDALNIGKTNKKSAATTETNLSSDDLNYHFSTVAENLLASTNDNRTTSRSHLPPKPGKPLYGFERFTPASICLSIKSIDNKKSTVWTR